MEEKAAITRGRSLARLGAFVVLALTAVSIAWWQSRGGDDSVDVAAAATTAATTTTTLPAATTTVPITEPPTTIATTTTVPPFEGWLDPASAGGPWGMTPGVLTFRGNPTRSWYGLGPVPANPQVLWRYPRSGGMCGSSTAGGETKTWCGTGWTGQPSVFERDGRTWVVFGAYDYTYNFLDADSGERILPSFRTGDINKGSATVDPDGYPLLYAGSRDNYLRVIAIDRDEPIELWRLAHNDVSPTMWNSDWDGAPVVIDDYLFEGGENSQFHIVKLNRGYGPDGKVTVDPQLVFNAPGWDEQLLDDIGDRDVSIENSVAVSGNTVWFANSGGLVQGWDITGLAEGAPPTRTFRFWTGDDTDASIVIDAEGYLYVASEYQRFNQRALDVGQLMKLDPRRPDDPIVWSIADNDYRGFENAAGIWSTPAIYNGVVVTTTNGGKAMGIDQMTGEVLWTKRLPAPAWSSPVIVDDVWVQGDCNGVLHGYDFRDPRVEPPQLWAVEIGGCIESTPTVWKGRIYVGSRSGGFYAVG